MTQQGINLLPQEYREVEEKSTRIRKVSVICVSELLILVGLVGGSYYYHRQVSQEWSFYQQQVVDQKEFINQEENRRLEGKMRVVKGKLDTLGDFLGDRVEYSVFIEGILDLLPPGVKLASIEQKSSESDFEVRGRADNLEQIDKFVSNIREWQAVESVTLLACDYEVDDVSATFSLSIKKV